MVTTREKLFSRAIERTADAFLEVRANARRFHGGDLGRDVDPEHCLCDFLCRIRADDHAGLEKVYKAAMSEDQGGIGGYLVPTLLSTALYDVIAENAIVRPRASVVPMTTLQTTVPVPDYQTLQSSGTSPFFGGMSFKWTQTGTESTRPLSETEPTWREVVLVAFELAGYALLSNDLFADWTAGTEAYLNRLIGAACAWAEDLAFLIGTGLGQPQGMQTCPAALSVTRNAATDFKGQDAAAMLAKLLPVCYGRACWAVSPLVVNKLVQMSAPVWQANETNPPGPGGGPLGYLLNHSLYVSEKLPPLGTAGDVLLFDPALYLVGDRRQAAIEVSGHEPTAFVRNQSVIRVVHRVGGQPALSASVRLQDASTVVSPYVFLT